MKKLTFIFSLLSIICLAACDRSDDNLMKCGEFEVEIAMQKSDSIIATINGDRAELAHTVSASGAQYSGVLNDVTIVLWSHGNDWTLSLNGDAPIECE